MIIGLTYDLKDEYLEMGFTESQIAEFDSADTIDSLQEAIESLGHQCVRIGHVRALAQRLVAGERWDLVFNIAEGLAGYGRESQVPALLEAYGIAYTFSDPLVCALTLHKAMAKHVARGHGIATPDFALVRSPEDAKRIDLALPLFIKPVAEGTSKGVDAASLVTERSMLVSRCVELLRRYEQPVLVERFLPGREFTVGIIGTGNRAYALATLEVVLLERADAKVYSYRNKAEWRDLVEYRLLDDGKLRTEVEALAVETWRCFDCRDAGRVDVRLDESGVPQLIEVNPLAGLAPGHSDLPIMAALSGIGYAQLIGAILDSAMERSQTSSVRDAAA